MNLCESQRFQHKWKYDKPTKMNHESGEELAYIATKRECVNCWKIEKVMWQLISDGAQA